MKTLPILAAAVSLALALPMTVQAHKKHDEADTSGCDMKGMDMSKMSAEDHQKMLDQCAAEKKAKDCDMNGMDMSKMSAEDRQKMMAACQKNAPAPASKGGS